MPDIDALLNSADPVIAVVGASDAPGKYGSTIYRDLKRKGFRVYPVNPRATVVDGDAAYRTLHDLPEPADIVNFVIPPTRTLAVLERSVDLDLGVVWTQPGAGDDAVAAFLEGRGVLHVMDECIMVRSRRRSPMP
jgi:hypothetical protein